MSTTDRFAVYGRPVPLAFADGSTGWRTPVVVGDGQALLTVVRHLTLHHMDSSTRIPHSSLSVRGRPSGPLEASGGWDTAVAHTHEIFAIDAPLPEQIELTVVGLGGDTHHEVLTRQ